MYKLYPYFTNDGSVGLFSPEADDIYHSTYGALSEAYEKFILPANLNKYLKNNSEIKVLDICFGIGYNSKSFLNYFLENIQNNKKINSKNTNIVSIYTDKINNRKQTKNCNQCIEKIDTYNNFRKIFIHAIDTDKNLIYLSPFFKSNEKNFKNEQLSFRQDKISKMMNKKVDKKYILKNEVNIILLKNIIENDDSIFADEEFKYLISEKKYRRYFDKNMINLFKFYENYRYSKTYKSPIKAFLHNIYYQYLSNSYKRALKYLNLNEICIKPEIEDARKILKETDNIYNIIFLDAFTPAKCPCLWTLDFFSELYKHLDDEGIILTYSNSANIRNAFIQAGFYIAKIFNTSANKYMGTAAFKNRNLILENDYLTELSEYDLGLLKTKAGIIYRDKDLNLDNETIINNHKKDVDSSNLISSSKYIKSFRKNKNNYKFL